MPSWLLQVDRTNQSSEGDAVMEGASFRHILRSRGREAMIAAQAADSEKFVRSQLRARGDAILASVQRAESCGMCARPGSPANPETLCPGAHERMALYGRISSAWPQSMPWSYAGALWPGYAHDSWTSASEMTFHGSPHNGCCRNSVGLAPTASVASIPFWELPIKVHLDHSENASLEVKDQNAVSLADILPPPGL